MPQLLAGLRVVEGASFVAGPSCGLHMSQMGAEVIRFDPIGGGPDYRRWPLAPNGTSLYWEGLNKGKKSIAIDLRRPAGRELAVALASSGGEAGGLFVTNFPVDGFLSHANLRSRRDDIISVRIMGWSDGSPALDYTVNAAAGVPYMTGPAQLEGPVNHVLPAWDLLAGSYAAFSAVAALMRRKSTGQGAELRIALSDVAITALGHLGQIAESICNGERGRFGNELYGAFGRDFLCSDGNRIMLVAITARQWQALLTALDVEDAVAELEQEIGISFAADEGARFVHRSRLFPLFEEVIGRFSLAELAPRLDQRGATWSRYQSLSEAIANDSRLVARNARFQDLAHPSGLTYPAAGPAAALAGEPTATLARAPHLGEHTDLILSEVLGLDGGAIGRLHDQGLVA